MVWLKSLVPLIFSLVLAVPAWSGPRDQTSPALQRELALSRIDGVLIAYEAFLTTTRSHDADSNAQELLRYADYDDYSRRLLDTLESEISKLEPGLVFQQVAKNAIERIRRDLVRDWDRISDDDPDDVEDIDAYLPESLEEQTKAITELRKLMQTLRWQTELSSLDRVTSVPFRPLDEGLEAYLNVLRDISLLHALHTQLKDLEQFPTHRFRRSNLTGDHENFAEHYSQVGFVEHVISRFLTTVKNESTNRELHAFAQTVHEIVQSLVQKQDDGIIDSADYPVKGTDWLQIHEQFRNHLRDLRLKVAEFESTYESQARNLYSLEGLERSFSTRQDVISQELHELIARFRGEEQRHIQRLETLRVDAQKAQAAQREAEESRREAIEQIQALALQGQMLGSQAAAAKSSLDSVQRATPKLEDMTAQVLATLQGNVAEPAKVFVRVGGQEKVTNHPQVRALGQRIADDLDMNLRILHAQNDKAFKAALSPLGIDNVSITIHVDFNDAKIKGWFKKSLFAHLIVSADVRVGAITERITVANKPDLEFPLSLRAGANLPIEIQADINTQLPNEIYQLISRLSAAGLPDVREMVRTACAEMMAAHQAVIAGTVEEKGTSVPH